MRLLDHDGVIAKLSAHLELPIRQLHTGYDEGPDASATLRRVGNGGRDRHRLLLDPKRHRPHIDPLTLQDDGARHSLQWVRQRSQPDRHILEVESTGRWPGKRQALQPEIHHGEAIEVAGGNVEATGNLAQGRSDEGFIHSN